jgi:hypothetical protein
MSESDITFLIFVILPSPKTFQAQKTSTTKQKNLNHGEHREHRGKTDEKRAIVG